MFPYSMYTYASYLRWISSTCSNLLLMPFQTPVCVWRANPVPTLRMTTIASTLTRARLCLTSWTYMVSVTYHPVLTIRTTTMTTMESTTTARNRLPHRYRRLYWYALNDATCPRTCVCVVPASKTTTISWASLRDKAKCFNQPLVNSSLRISSTKRTVKIPLHS